VETTDLAATKAVHPYLTIVNSTQLCASTIEQTHPTRTFFLADVPKNALFDAYLKSFPEEERQHHNCTCCRKFLNKVGQMVYIDDQDDYKLKSVLWDSDFVGDAYFKDGIEAMRQIVEKAPIKNAMFSNNNGVYGKKEDGGFNHFFYQSAGYNILHVTRSLNRGIIREKFAMMKLAVESFKIETISAAVSIFKLDPRLVMYPTMLKVLTEFLILAEAVNATKNQRKIDALIWNAVVNGMAGMIHIRSTTLGEFLFNTQHDDHTAPKPDTDVAIAKFIAMTNADVYMRPTTAPSDGNKEQAEKIIEELGLADSLKRRHAHFSEIQKFFWKPSEVEVKEPEPVKRGVFAAIVSKEDKEKAALAPEQTVTDVNNMTWSLFKSKYLPNVAKFELLFRSTTRYGFGSFATEEIAGSKPILRWDKKDNRNPINGWSVRGGAPAGPVLNINDPIFDCNATKWVTVRGIVHEPQTWNGAMDYQSLGELVILEGGSLDAPQSCLFPEIVLSELHPVRKTIEAYSSQNPLSTPENLDQAVFVFFAIGGIPQMPFRATLKDGGIIAGQFDRYE
jgi:hypothetical protein